MSTKLKVIDLFCGVGGLSYGFGANRNFEIVAANEILPNMAKAYSLNHPDVKVYVEDVKCFSVRKVISETAIDHKTVDVIVGGPPCQAFSTVGKRLLDDPRAELFKEYYRVLSEFSPRLFLFENVKGLLSIQGGALFEEIVRLFESLGYEVKWKVLNAADFGAPQYRERIILVGSRLKRGFNFPEATHSANVPGLELFVPVAKPHITLEEAIGDLPFINSGEESICYATEPQNEFQRRMRSDAPETLMDHNAPKNNAKLVKLMKMLPDGGSPEDLPKELRPSSGFRNTYCRLWWKRPSTTITRNLGTPSSSRCIHPKAPRALTTREGARIQCFPDSYKFYGSRTDRNLQVGNAVPTVLSTALAGAILENFNADNTI